MKRSSRYVAATTEGCVTDKTQNRPMKAGNLRKGNLENTALQDSTPRITTGRALDGKRHAEEVPFVTLTDRNGQFHSSGYFLKYTVYDDTSGRCQLTLQVLVQGYFYYRQE